jgi:hypothetical protein
MPVIKRKRRIRRHVIADLSFHHVAYQVVKCGFTIEATRSDYGYDGSIFTYNSRGEIENGTIFVQLKATDRITRYKRPRAFSFPIEKRDVDLWRDEPFPVYLILFDATSEVAYWRYLQEYLETEPVAAFKKPEFSLRVQMNASQIVDAKSIHEWRRHKARVLASIGSISHVQ